MMSGSTTRTYVTEPFDSGDKANKLYYAFTRHHNRFIIVDSMEDYDPCSRQYAWLEGELAQARKTAVNTFVMFHEGAVFGRAARADPGSAAVSASAVCEIPAARSVLRP